MVLNAIQLGKPFWMICLTHMFIEIYLLTQVALIPVFMVEFQVSLLEASLVPTIQSLIGILMNLPSGFLADHVKTKYLLFGSMVIEGLSAILLSQTNSFWILLLGVALLRISSPIYHISGLSKISRIVKQEQINRSMGFHNAFGSLGSAIGAISLTIFLSTVGWRWNYLFWALPVLTWSFILLKSPQTEIKKTEKRVNESRGRLSRFSFIFSISFLLFLITIAIREVGITGTSTFMTTYLVNMRGLDKATASLIFGLGPIMGVVGSLNGGYLGEKIGAKKALSIAIFGCSIAIPFLAFFSNVYLLTFAYLLYSFFNNSVWTPMNTMVVDITPVVDRGVGFSTYFLTEGLIQAVTPTIAATVIALTEVWYIFPFSIIFVVVSLIVLQFLPYPKKPLAELEKTRTEA